MNTNNLNFQFQDYANFILPFSIGIITMVDTPIRTLRELQ